MKRHLIRYLTVASIFLALDSIWLGLTGDMLYRRRLGAILLEGFRPVPAVVFYALYIAGILVFAVEPANRSGRWSEAAGRGAFLGLIAYGTYDLTNQATLKTWPTVITAADLTWGMLATALAAGLGFALTRSRAAKAAEAPTDEKHQPGNG